MLAYSASRVDNFIASSFFISSRGALSVSFASTSAVLRRRLAALAAGDRRQFLARSPRHRRVRRTPHAVVVAVDRARAPPQLIGAGRDTAAAASASSPPQRHRRDDVSRPDMAERSTARSNSGVHASSITVPECGTKLAPFAVAVSAYFIAACLRRSSPPVGRRRRRRRHGGRRVVHGRQRRGVTAKSTSRRSRGPSEETLAGARV